MRMTTQSEQKIRLGRPPARICRVGQVAKYISVRSCGGPCGQWQLTIRAVLLDCPKAKSAGSMSLD
jgi:hypothetical protein